jgi:hypothetical protein
MKSTRLCYRPGAQIDRRIIAEKTSSDKHNMLIRDIMNRDVIQ